MIARDKYVAQIERALDESPVVALLGPRQCGKTTLARIVKDKRPSCYLDLENPRDAAKLAVPLGFLEQLSGLIVIDEIQRNPGIFEVLRVLVDRENYEGKFLILGSASPRLIKRASESLAGRVAFVDLSGFDLQETGGDDFRRLWDRGGFPRSYLASSAEASLRWREDFARSFLERDIPQLGITVPAETLRRFWVMIAHYHGQVWNAAEFARSLGSAEATARRYLDILSGAYMVRQLQPWHENLKKRQVKAPKIYVRDSGILHSLLGIENHSSLLSHVKSGASWEGFVAEQLHLMLGPRDIYYWATYSGAEIDALLIKGGKRIGVEAKFTDSPRVTNSIRIARQDLGLDQVYIVHPGDESFLLEHNVRAISVRDLHQIVI